jgi:hypothetical protein
MEVQPLQYAAKPPVIRTRLARRILIASAVVAVLMPIVLRSPTLWTHIRLLYWQRQAMGYSLPPDEIVFSENGDRSSMKTAPGCMSQGARSFIFAVPWDRFYQLASPPGRQSTATLFLHQLQNGRGESRLVSVEGIEVATITVFRPGSMFKAPQELSSNWIPLQAGLYPSISYYAGQTDPKDPSHFTIKMVTSNGTEMFHGWLKDDDTVATVLEAGVSGAVTSCQPPPRR